MPSSDVRLEASGPVFGPAEEAQLRESLRRCSPATIEAAVAFRRHRDLAQMPSVVLGVMERFLEPDMRRRLREGGDEIRVVEDLGVDSLTLMEIVMMVEEALAIAVRNEELRHLRTVGDLKTFLDCKVRGVPPPPPSKHLGIEQILGIMPHQPPFLFLQDATLSGAGATGTYRISGQEAFLQGHFRDRPVFPASVLLEALGQLAVLHLLAQPLAEVPGAVDPERLYFASCEGIRCHRPCRPGDVLQMAVKLVRVREPLATFEGTIRVAGEKAVTAEDLTLAFACKPAAGTLGSETAAESIPDLRPALAGAAHQPPATNGTHPGRNGQH